MAPVDPALPGYGTSISSTDSRVMAPLLDYGTGISSIAGLWHQYIQRCWVSISSIAGPNYGTSVSSIAGPNYGASVSSIAGPNYGTSVSSIAGFSMNETYDVIAENAP